MLATTSPCHGILMKLLCCLRCCCYYCTVVVPACYLHTYKHRERERETYWHAHTCTFMRALSSWHCHCKASVGWTPVCCIPLCTTVHCGQPAHSGQSRPPTQLGHLASCPMIIMKFADMTFFSILTIEGSKHTHTHAHPIQMKCVTLLKYWSRLNIHLQGVYAFWHLKGLLRPYKVYYT